MHSLGRHLELRLNNPRDKPSGSNAPNNRTRLFDVGEGVRFQRRGANNGSTVSASRELRQSTMEGRERKGSRRIHQIKKPRPKEPTSKAGWD